MDLAAVGDIALALATPAAFAAAGFDVAAAGWVVSFHILTFCLCASPGHGLRHRDRQEAAG